MRTRIGLIAAGVVLAAACAGQRPATRPVGPTRYARWTSGPAKRADYFPIAVWLQAPKNAAKYKAAGINLYVGLWKGPTDRQLAELAKAGMPVICHQNAVGLCSRHRKVIVGWMHGDEPDNAQSRGQGKGYGPPIPPARVVADYKRIRADDATRPVLLNLGQGVAWDGWHGRGVRTNHPEDYPRYVQGCDIASFDIYPAVHSHPQVAGKLWFVARGVKRLSRWAGPRRIVWNCIECTRISNVKVKPTPAQVRAEVWMSIIHGSRGLIYFVHQFKPKSIEAGLLADREMLAAVTAINRQVRELAAVINGPPVADPAKVTPTEDTTIASMTRRHDRATYVFGVNMRGVQGMGVFRVPGVAGGTAVVLGEGRRIPAPAGRFSDKFGPYDVHLYRIE
jgi:hypothetical protein